MDYSENRFHTRGIPGLTNFASFVVLLLVTLTVTAHAQPASTEAIDDDRSCDGPQDWWSGMGRTKASCEAVAATKEAVNRKDTAEALRQTQVAADLGDIAGLVGMGGILEEGLAGMTTDYAGAIKYYMKAGEKGDVGSMHKIGLLYFVGGHGISQDKSKAIYWIKQAYGRGSDEARRWLDDHKLLEEKPKIAVSKSAFANRRTITITSHDGRSVTIFKVVVNDRNDDLRCDFDRVRPKDNGTFFGNSLNGAPALRLGDQIEVVTGAFGICGEPVKVDVGTDRGFVEFEFN